MICWLPLIHHPSAGKASAENAGSFLVTRTVLPSVPPSQEIDEMDPSKQGEYFLLGFSIQTADTGVVLDFWVTE